MAFRSESPNSKGSKQYSTRRHNQTNPYLHPQGASTDSLPRPPHLPITTNRHHLIRTRCLSYLRLLTTIPKRHEASPARTVTVHRGYTDLAIGARWEDSAGVGDPASGVHVRCVECACWHGQVPHLWFNAESPEWTDRDECLALGI